MLKILSSLPCLLPVLAVLTLASCNRAPSAERPNVIVLLLDTLRADHLGTYGYERNTSPVLDAFAKENIKFNYAITASPWTPPSVASILTGLYPATHRMMPPNDREVARKTTTRLNPNLDTLPEILKKLGYRTAAVSPNPWITEDFGYDQGFDHFFYHPRAIASKINTVAKKVIDNWLTDSADKSPFFLYLHYLDPHDPYNPPAEYRELFKGEIAARPAAYNDRMLELIGHYDGEIRYLDTELGKLFEFLKTKGLYENTVIVVVGDHGEQFRERGDHRHGYQLFNEEVHIPLLLRVPKLEAKAIDRSVSTVDIYPTILELLGQPLPSSYPGVSLLKADSSDRPGVYSEIFRVYDQRAFINQLGEKLLLSTKKESVGYESAEREALWESPKSLGLFNRQSDYFEASPITDPALQAKLQGELSSSNSTALALKIAPAQNQDQGMNDEKIDELRSLGYLN